MIIKRFLFKIINRTLIFLHNFFRQFPLSEKDYLKKRDITSFYNWFQHQDKMLRHYRGPVNDKLKQKFLNEARFIYLYLKRHNNCKYLQLSNDRTNYDATIWTPKDKFFIEVTSAQDHIGEESQQSTYPDQRLSKMMLNNLEIKRILNVLEKKESKNYPKKCWLIIGHDGKYLENTDYYYLKQMIKQNLVQKKSNFQRIILTATSKEVSYVIN